MTSKRSTARPPLFTAPFSRTIACTLGVLITSVIVGAGATLYLPINEIDRIGMPAVLFPLIWLGLLFFATMTRNIRTVWLWLTGLCTLHTVLIYWHLTGA
ncbi:MAG: hypothetical protein WD071_16100 [Pseudohongiella sp.]|uniref:hypothetical protein n=1 Tax=Pseudohongiella sp. TaxID=1979412 RepID=UPI0034A03F4A